MSLHCNENLRQYTLKYLLCYHKIHLLVSLLLSVAGGKWELLTAVLSFIFLIKSYTLPSRFYTSNQTSTSSEVVMPADYGMQVTYT
jgi:hypothetical protein